MLVSDLIAALQELSPTTEVVVEHGGIAFSIESVDNDYFLNEGACELREYDDSMESGNYRRVITISSSNMTW